jgi:3-hydroxyacyl-[acyl-carrier-protein] dehydratase
MPPEQNYDIGKIDLNHIIADKEAIRRVNPQRFEFEHLDAIVYVDPPQHLIAGYKDVGHDEFWVRGHLPGYPIMPGVLICEAAAQLCAFYFRTYKIMGGDFMGFGGLENVRFRGPVYPGSRLLLVAKATKVNRRQTICNVQGFANQTMVFHGDIIGMPLSRKGDE